MGLLGKGKQRVKSPHVLLGEKARHTLFAEAYRTLRANIHLTSVDENIRSLLVTSAGSGEGKTSVSANIGWTLSRENKSVVLVDCDFRRPCLSKTVSTRSSIGLTGLISDVLGSKDWSGPEGWTLPDVLALMELQRRTGKLLVADGKTQVELFFFQGQATDLAWLTCPQNLELPHLLRQEGLLQKQQEGEHLHQYPLGSIINSIGLVDTSRLKGILALHVAEALHALKTMQAPTFEFTELSEHQLHPELHLDLAQQVNRTLCVRNELPYIDTCIRQALVAVDVSLAVLPSGAIPPNPSEVSGSSRLHFILSRLRHMYDFVIVDTPPVLPVSDALLLAPHLDGVLMVVRTGAMNRQVIAKAIEQVRDSKARLLGLVLNQVDTKRERYYQYYQQYSSGYYGEQSK